MSVLIVMRLWAALEYRVI